MNADASRAKNDDPKIHSHALVDENVQIGARTRVWAFSHILPGAVVGEDCNICDHTFIEGKVVLGSRVTVKCGVYLWDGVTAEDDVFIGPAAVFTNDLKPRSQQYPREYAKTILKQGCSIGANSTIIAGNTIGAWSLIGAASVVTRDVPDYAVVWGNPAKFQYWICQCNQKMSFENSDEFLCKCGYTYKFNNKENKVFNLSGENK
jgi:acetyltransferase-like isoleucine patch superfamily enzyme